MTTVVLILLNLALIAVFAVILRRPGLLGFAKSETGELSAIPAKGLFAGLFWYVVISPVLVL